MLSRHCVHAPLHARSTQRTSQVILWLHITHSNATCPSHAQSFSLGVYEVPGYYQPGPGALDVTQADALHRGLLIQLLPQVLAMRTFPPLPCAQLTKGFFDAPDPMLDVAICFIKVRDEAV